MRILQIGGKYLILLCVPILGKLSLPNFHLPCKLGLLFLMRFRLNQKRKLQSIKK